MLILPKLDKGMKQAMTKLEKVSKAIVGAALVVGLSTVALPSNEAEAAIVNSMVTTPTQGAMVLTPSASANTMIAYHYSHFSHQSHSSHYSHYSHYSSRY